MLFFFFSFTATSVCSTLSLHDALPICWLWRCGRLRRLSWFLNALRFRRWARLGLGLRFRLGFGLLLRLIAVFTLRGVWSFARRSLWLWFGRSEERRVGKDAGAGGWLERETKRVQHRSR